MEVIVDGASGYAPAGAPDDVMGMIADISRALQAKGRAVLSVKADGQDLRPEQLVEVLSGKPLSTVAKLEVVSASTSALVAESLAELEAVLPELAKACHELAAVFQGTDPQSGYTPFQELADIWAHVKMRQDLIAHTLGFALDSIEIDGTSVGALHTGLNEILSEAAGAIESGDLILLGDLLEYELAPRAETEVRIAALLRERSGG
ncbi:MAG: hypothetical protein FJY92_12880 [Candidatus Hydrogenedentes bacterium]|nr:hypothetical protein [Candidatus Hydrogenedentota bacterium]